MLAIRERVRNIIKVSIVAAFSCVLASVYENMSPARIPQVPATPEAETAVIAIPQLTYECTIQ